MNSLHRVPSRQYENAVANLSPYASILSKFDYVTADGRWRVEKYTGCGGGWVVIDTTGRYRCLSCRITPEHTALVRTLSAAAAFISEWSA